MRPTTLFPCLLPVIGIVTKAYPFDNDTQTVASRQIAKWQKDYNQWVKTTVRTRQSGCTSDNILYRQEWGTLTQQSRKEYIQAVYCLQQKPPIYPKSVVPGARTRFDDFPATHIIVTPYVHKSGLFSPFHRYFIWLYEKALRDECGYKGTQPYWDWTLSWQDPRMSTVFDGSPTSMGGNGQSIPHGPLNTSAFGINLQLAPATGGGCIEKGPFANYTVNLGPVAIKPNGTGNGLAYNPRCLRRDLSLVWSNNTKPTAITSLINGYADLGSFQGRLEGLDGVHAGGHATMGSLEADAYASAADPAFYLHHAQVDRVWTLWQSINPKNRTGQVDGTSTAFNNPPSPNVTLDTKIDFGILAPQQRIGSLVSAIDGPFCYMYV